MFWGWLAWLLSAPYIMYDIDLCCDAVFRGTIGHSRPEEEEMDFAGMKFINWQYVGLKLCHSSSGNQS